MTPEALVLSLIWSDSARSVIDLALGFAVAGMLCSGYQLLTLQPASFGLLNEPERNRALAAVPFLLFAAPFIIIRNTIRGARIWSLMSGTVVAMAFQAVGKLVA
jgi:hypothetical protein